MSKSDNFNEKQLKVLEIYVELELIKFSKKKKDFYDEIQKRTKYNKNTIISWINKYLVKYKEIRAEIVEKQNAKICNFEGLTEKQTKYVIYRMSGIGKEEAKVKATRLNKILNNAIEGVDIIEYIDESSPDGHTVSKRVRKDKPLLAGVAAARELNSMLGYRATDEAKLKVMINSENDTAVSDEDFE